MNNDWDLSAIVRSCCERNVMKESFVYPDEIPVDLSSSPFPVLDHLRNELDDPFDELSRVYKPFYGRVQLNTAALAVTGAVVTPVADDSIIGGSENKRRRKEVQLPTNAAVAFIDDGAKENQKNVVGYQALRGRRRKQPRLVMKMNVASLSEDSWNWRKYGQKPIFGSMNPRSYYRCSSFKGCAARKQVERCEEEPGMFIVTYIGDHTHRKSDAGTTGVFTISGDSLKPSSEANNENSKQEDDDDIVMAMHALYSTGSAFSGGQPLPPPKSVGTAGGSAQTAVQCQDEPLDFSF